MPFEHCSECKRCCNVDPGYAPLEITLTAKETKTYHSICIERHCQYLGKQGCTLGQAKPFSCKMYPLVYRPATQEFLYDTECPVMPKYIDQLKTAGSQANQHLAFIQKEIKALSQNDEDFLERNFGIDEQYFETKKLPLANIPTRPTRSTTPTKTSKRSVVNTPLRP
jgi:Fe-S-cluster containining protein